MSGNSAINTNSQRKKKLLSLEQPTDEQRLELLLLQHKQSATVAEHKQLIDSYLTDLSARALPYSIYNYQQLISMAYTVDEIVEKTVALSADAIIDYETDSNEYLYWLEHRRNSKPFFLCTMYAGIILGHFSITPVLAEEALAFLRGELAETAFSIVAETDILTTPHYLYISSVVVREQFRNGPASMRLIRQGCRLINKHLASNPSARGYFAEAYSPAGRRLCEFLSMQNMGGNYYVNSARLPAES